MVVFRGERLPGAGRTARPSALGAALRTVAVGAAHLRVRGIGAAAASAAGGLPPIGSGPRETAASCPPTPS